MASEKWKLQAAERVMRRLRMESKAAENMIKPPLTSSDVVETSDYVFSPITPENRIGDSGQLLLAKKKDDRKRQYLVKHAYTDCAVNEFVYTKLAQAMDIKMPDAVLFRLSEGEKRRYFQTEYILGTKYLNIIKRLADYNIIRNEAINWHDFLCYQALYDMFLEDDSFEVMLATDGFIYRVDTSSSFHIVDNHLSQAGVNIELNGYNPAESVKNRMLSYCHNYNEDKEINIFTASLEGLTKKYGSECVQPYLDPFSRIQEIPDDYIDSFLNTLCYFYPDFIGDYFKLLIAAIQRASSSFLNTITIGGS